MTVAAGKTPYHTYSPGAAMAPEAIPFDFGDTDHLYVRVVGAAEFLDYGTDYSISGDYAAGEASITAMVDAGAAEWELFSETPSEQQLDLQETRVLPLGQYETELDRLCRKVREIAYNLTRAIMAPRGEQGGELPTGTAGQFLGIGAGGAIVALDPPLSDSGDPTLRTDLADDTGAVLVGYRSRSVRAKLDDWCTPLDYGAAGDGLTDDTAAIDTAMATGKHVVFPKGYTFLTDTVLGHAYAADRQIVELNGILRHSTTRVAILAPDYYGFFGLLSAFEREGVQLTGGGTLDGSRDSFTAGDQGSGLFLSNCPQAYIDGPLFKDFIDDAIKTFSCPEITIRRPTRLYNIRNIGCELRGYAANPYVAIGASAGFLGEAWTGTIYGPSGAVDLIAERIDDGQQGAGNGTAIDFSGAGATPPPPNNLRVSANIRDCLLGIWSENNVVGYEAYNISLDGVLIEGNIAGAGTVECSDGIGLIGVQGGTIRAALIKNQTNIAPPSGAETVGLNIINCTDVEVIGLRVKTDTGIADRMQHAVKLSGSARVAIHGGSQAGVTGISATLAPSIAAPIAFDPSVGAECSDVTINEFRGGTADETWGNIIPFTFALQNVPASATTNLLLAGEANIDKGIFPCAGRVVAMTARMSAAGAGTFTISPLVAASAQSALNITQATFGGGADTGTSRTRESAAQFPALSRLEVTITTDGSWVDTVDATATVWVDIGLKK